MDWKLYSIFINKLVLVDPQWIRNNPSLADGGGMLGATALSNSAMPRRVSQRPFVSAEVPCELSRGSARLNAVVSGYVEIECSYMFFSVEKSL